MSQKKQSGFMHWYESYSGKKVVNMVYCLGASVVIIGALFKIMHFPGAGPVLMTGMCTEAVLFAIGCLDKPHVDFHWEQVFPQIMGYGADPELLDELATRPKPTLLGNMGSNDAAKVPALDEKQFSALKEGIDGLAKTATQLNELGKVATATTQLAEKMEIAGQAATQFVSSMNDFGHQSQVLTGTYATVASDMQAVVEGTKAYQQNIEAMGQKVGKLNSVYEMQLGLIQTQGEKLNKINTTVDAVSADMQKMQTTISEAAQSYVAYEDGAKKLAQQVADLNKIYGNMLNALA